MKIATIDCETDPFAPGRIPAPFIWGFYDGKNFETFTDTADLIERCKRFRGTIYAHNGGKFDYHFIFDKAIEPGDGVKIINGRLAQWRCGNAIMRDSFNILPVPLAAMQKDEFEYWKLEREHRTEYWGEIVSYLRGDCVYLHKYIMEFVGEYGKKLTIAGAALDQWKKISGRNVPVSTREFYNEFRPYYYGGRVEPFKVGDFSDAVKVVDINSAYPAAMMHPHPITGRYYETENPRDSQLPAALLRVECRSRGALPHRGPDNSLSFPDRVGEFFCTGWEFIAGMETGTISDVTNIKAFVFQDTIDFSDYVGHFYAMKDAATKAGDKPRRMFAKLFLNSLYGKFATNPDKYRDYKSWEYGERPPEGWDIDGFIGDTQLISKPVEDDQAKFLNIVTAASITGWVRAFLWRSIQAVDTPYYCDTDSIICRDPGSLAISDRLGDWDVEATGTRVAVAGKKLYAVWDGGKVVKTACKGVRISAQQIANVANGETEHYTSIAPTFSTKSGISFCSRKVCKTA